MFFYNVRLPSREDSPLNTNISLEGLYQVDEGLLSFYYKINQSWSIHWCIIQDVQLSQIFTSNYLLNSGFADEEAMRDPQSQKYYYKKYSKPSNSCSQLGSQFWWSCCVVGIGFKGGTNSLSSLFFESHYFTNKVFSSLCRVLNFEFFKLI